MCFVIIGFPPSKSFVRISGAPSLRLRRQLSEPKKENCQYSIERQRCHQNLAPVPVIISGTSLVFTRQIITSTGFYLCSTPDASAPVVVSIQSPIECERKALGFQREIYIYIYIHTQGVSQMNPIAKSVSPKMNPIFFGKRLVLKVAVF